MEKKKVQPSVYGVLSGDSDRLHLAAPASVFSHHILDCIIHILIAKNQPIHKYIKSKVKVTLLPDPCILRGNHAYKYRIRFQCSSVISVILTHCIIALIGEI